MTTVDRAQLGAPCWADLWTSDVEGSRSFYGELFGWEALEPSPEFGGYFMWQHAGVPVAGGMGDMGDAKATDVWKVYLQTPDVATLIASAKDHGATIVFEPQPVADLGLQAGLVDPSGAHLGAWQPGTFQGFSTTGETSTPSWFELHTDDYARAVEFYASVFKWQTAEVADTDEFRYTVMLDPGNGGELAGIMDAAPFLGGSRSYWSIYWQVEDVAASFARVAALGGSVIEEAMDTPYGTLGTVADPSGARFKLRTPPAG